MSLRNIDLGFVLPLAEKTIGVPLRSLGTIGCDHSDASLDVERGRHL